MKKSNHAAIADRWVTHAVKLTRWLRAADPAPTLSGAQVSALAVIGYSGGITPSALAELEEVKRPTIARTISQLLELGLIERLCAESDKRSVVLVATKSGQTVLTKGQQRRITPFTAQLQKLAPDELEAIHLALASIEKILEGAIGRSGRSKKPMSSSKQAID